MAGKTLEFMLTGAHEDNLDDTFENIQMCHNLSSLPRSFTHFLTALIHLKAKKRIKDTIKLDDLAEEVVEDLNQEEIFAFQNMAMVPVHRFNFMGTSSFLASFSYPT